MRFSWPGVLLAPVVAPALFSVASAGLFGSNSPGLLVLIMLAAGCLISYATTALVFLPCLFVLSAIRPMTWVSVCLLGAVLGGASDVPMTWMAWRGSGPDSGPPEEHFLTFFWRWEADPFTLLFPAAGLVTAGTYWALGTWWSRRAGHHLPEYNRPGRSD